VDPPYTCPAMPTYEYRCRDCGHSFDIVQKMSDETLTHCPECGGRLRKVFAPPAISFKGSGFYATDHGKKAKHSTDAKGSDGGEKKSSDAKTESSTAETKTSDTKKSDTASTSTTKKEGSS
jgi:putative FmdB family regulatory protein